MFLECIFLNQKFLHRISKILTERSALPLANLSGRANLSQRTSLLSLFVFHSNKLGHFASIRQNVTEKAILTLLGRRSTRLDIVFPSSTTPLPRAHTHSHSGMASLLHSLATLVSSRPAKPLCVCACELGSERHLREIQFQTSLLRPNCG